MGLYFRKLSCLHPSTLWRSSEEVLATQSNANAAVMTYEALRFFMSYQHCGTPGGPTRPPKQQYIPPCQSIFPKHPQLWVTTGSASLKSKVKTPTHLPHAYPSQGTPYQHSGTPGGPIRPPKQQYIPPKQSIFPKRR